MTRPDDDREVPEPAEPDDEEFEARSLGVLPFEAEPADVLEQAQSVPADDDDYR